MQNFPRPSGPGRCRGDPGRQWFGSIKGAMLTLRTGPKGQVGLVAVINFAQLEAIIHLSGDVTQVQPHLAAVAWVVAHSIALVALFTGSRYRRKPTMEDQAMPVQNPGDLPPVLLGPEESGTESPRTRVRVSGFAGIEYEWFCSADNVHLHVIDPENPACCAVVVLNFAQLEALVQQVKKIRQFEAFLKSSAMKPE